jgi:CheY-like chemotaxis protein
MSEDRVRVLYAEDNPVNQQVMRALLAPLDLDLTVVDNGQLAVVACEGVAFDLILMDIQMPEMDGLTATRAIRAGDSPNQGAPIIAVTANAMAGDRDMCLAAGMTDYVSKPVAPTRLIEAIVGALQAKAAA